MATAIPVRRWWSTREISSVVLGNHIEVTSTCGDLTVRRVHRNCSPDRAADAGVQPVPAPHDTARWITIQPIRLLVHLASAGAGFSRRS
jgi:hypothetical protein